MTSSNGVDRDHSDLGSSCSGLEEGVSSLSVSEKELPKNNSVSFGFDVSR